MDYFLGFLWGVMLSPFLRVLHQVTTKVLRNAWTEYKNAE